MKCLAALAAQAGQSLWQHTSSGPSGIIVELSSLLTSTPDPGTQQQALHTIRAVAVSLVSGLQWNSLSVAQEEDFQDAMSAALTFLADQHSKPAQAVLGSLGQLVQEVLSC